MKTFKVSKNVVVETDIGTCLLESGDIIIIEESKLSTEGRKHIAKKNFVFPKTKEDNKGHYPIHDKKHAANARSRASQLKKQSAWMKKRGLSIKEVKDRVYSKTAKFFKDED